MFHCAVWCKKGVIYHSSWQHFFNQVSDIRATKSLVSYWLFISVKKSQDFCLFHFVSLLSATLVVIKYVINLCVNLRYLTDSSRERWDFSLERTHAEGITKKYLAVLFTFCLREWMLLAVLREQWPAASSGYDWYVFCVFWAEIRLFSSSPILQAFLVPGKRN